MGNEKGNEINNFKVLEKLQEEKYSKNIQNVKDSIDGNLGGLSFFTNIIDVYFARVVSYFLSSGSGINKKKNRDNNK